MKYILIWVLGVIILELILPEFWMVGWAAVFWFIIILFIKHKRGE